MMGNDKFVEPDRYNVLKDNDSSVILDVEEERALLNLYPTDEIKNFDEIDKYSDLKTSRGVSGVYEVEHLVEVLHKNNASNIFVVTMRVLNTPFTSSSVGVESNIIVPITPTSDTDSLCSSSMSTNQTFSSNETITTPSNSSSKAVKTLKSWSDNTPRKKSLVEKYKMEKAALIEADKAVVTLTNQLANLKTEDIFFKYCENHLPPSLYIIIESHMHCKNTLALEKNVGLKLKEAFFNVPFNHPCPNFDVVFLLKLYVRFRVFSALKFLNRELISKRKLKNRKLTIIKHL